MTIPFNEPLQYGQVKIVARIIGFDDFEAKEAAIDLEIPYNTIKPVLSGHPCSSVKCGRLGKWLFNEGLAGLVTIPVSYTHLDVYKRQH